jgi:hypothetical protein
MSSKGLIPPNSSDFKMEHEPESPEEHAQVIGLMWKYMLWDRPLVGIHMHIFGEDVGTLGVDKYNIISG